jgi:large subunit ribosomal protein L21
VALFAEHFTGSAPRLRAVARRPTRVLESLARFSGGRVYAIIRSGGKQYRVAQGDVVSVERDALAGASEDKVTFNEVLMVGGDSPKVGNPLVSGASVAATVVRETRGEKIIVFKKKRRKNHTKRKHGHRQDLIELRIDSINI